MRGLIRQERKEDHAAIADVTAQAFAGVAHSDQTEPAIIAGLRKSGSLTISLVAAEGGAIVGHVAFSPVTIEGTHQGWFGLGPVSVLPARQGKGIGRALIETGLDQLRSRNAAGCVVLGDPAYYGRFGFTNDGVLQYEGAPPHYFMRLPFSDAMTAGRVAYHPAFLAARP